LLLAILTPLKRFELATIDMRMLSVSSAQPDAQIVVCDLNIRSPETKLRWPLSEGQLARLIRILHRASARTIAFAFTLQQQSEEAVQDGQIVDAIHEAGDVLLGVHFTRERPSTDQPCAAQDFPILPVDAGIEPREGSTLVDYPGATCIFDAVAEAARGRGGHLETFPDTDGVIRRHPLVLLHRHSYFPSLALKAVQQFRRTCTNRLRIEVRPYYGLIPSVWLGDTQIPVTEDAQMGIVFPQPGRTFLHYSIADVLQGKFPRNSFEGKLVFIRPSSTESGELSRNSYDEPASTVDIQAAVADNLLARRFVRCGAPEIILGLVAVAGLCLVGGLCAFTVLRPWHGLMAVLGAVVMYALLAQIALDAFSRHIFLFSPILGSGIAFSTAIVLRSGYAEARTRTLLKWVWSRLPHWFRDLVEEPPAPPDYYMIQRPPVPKELTLLVSDIRDYTSLSEQLTDSQMNEMRSEFLSSMSEVALLYTGTIDRYMGDSFIAFFGDDPPEGHHARLATEAALMMRRKLVSLNERWKRQSLPPLSCGVGIHTAVMLVGDVGGKYVHDHGVTGHPVALASRLEGLTKHYGVDIIASEATVRNAGTSLCFRELGLVRVKGKEGAVRVYELCGLASEVGFLEPFLRAFGKGLEAYRTYQFAEAERLFREAESLRGEDRTTRAYLERSASYQHAPPPKEWDFVEDIATK